MKNIPKLLILILLALATPKNTSAKSEILWDTYGIPHIFADSNQEMFYAFGWAQARSHGDLILRLYGQARGRAAEYWGESFLESDTYVHTMNIPNRAQKWLKEQEPEFLSFLTAFADGFNDYSATHSDKISDHMEAALPITEGDLLMHVQRVIFFHFVIDPRELTGAVKQWQGAGSNAWAVAPSRSASGHAILVANPHLLWGDLFTWYETHLVTPNLNVSGATMAGMPGVGIQFNDYLGWTHTVNTIDAADLYKLDLKDDGYIFDGVVRAFKSRDIELKVKNDDGSTRTQTLTVKESVHGPVVSAKGGHALALRVAGLDQSQMLSERWNMGRAKNLDEFKSALKNLQTPMFTVMYADREGNIMHLFGGRVPVRPAGDWDWAGVVPGNTSATLWTETHTIDELPQVTNPKSGWLQNANDPPWTTTFPEAIDADDYPDYMSPREMGFRAQRSAKMLHEDQSLSYDEVVAYKFSNRMELADRILDDLLSLAINSSDPIIIEAEKVLSNWDRTCDAESRGGVLFKFWVDKMGAANNFAEVWDESRPRTTPDGLADPEKAVSVLKSVAAEVQKKYGSLDVQWGEVFRLKHYDLDLPSNGAPGDPYGVFRTTYYAPDENDRFRALGGDTYVAVIEFTNHPKAMAVLGYGNSSQPRSPHRTDQMHLYAAKKLRPVWRTRAEVEANLEEREVLRYKN